MFGIYGLTDNQKKLQEEIVLLVERFSVAQIGDTEEVTQKNIEAEAEILAERFGR